MTASAIKTPAKIAVYILLSVILSAAIKLIIIYIVRKAIAVKISVPRMKESEASSAFLTLVLPRA